GNTTRFTYDTLGRQVTKTLPLGDVETRVYDAGGNLIRLTDFNGQTTTFTTDVMNRLVRRTLPEGEHHDFTYTPTGKVATINDANGTTTFAYDLRDRPTVVRQPDETEISYAYDAHGNRTAIT